MAATGFSYYKAITITASDAAVQYYSVKLDIDHAALVSASKSAADGSDLRIFYDSTTNFSGSETELDRVLWDLDGTTDAWNDSATTIAFRIQAAIGASAADSTHYRMYYGKASPGTPPTNKNNVYIWFDDFSTDQLATSYTIPASASWSVTGGRLLRSGSGGDEWACCYRTAAGPTQKFELQAKIQSETGLSSSNIQQGFKFDDALESGYNDCARWRDDSNLFQMNIANTDRSSSADATFDCSNEYTFRFSKDNRVFNWYCQGVQKVTFTAGGDYSDRPYHGLFVRDATAACDKYFDDFRVRHFTTNEPALTLGTEQSAPAGGAVIIPRLTLMGVGT